MAVCMRERGKVGVAGTAGGIVPLDFTSLALVEGTHRSFHAFISRCTDL